MYVGDLINEFLESLEIESGRSRYTTRNYELCLSRIIEFSEETNPLSNGTRQMLVGHYTVVSSDCATRFFEVFSKARN